MGSFDDQVLATARDYKALTQASSNWNLAPAPCSPAIKPVELFMSDARGDQAHSRKLYLLFVGDRESYLKASTTQAPIGQRLVKSSFEALPIAPKATIVLESELPLEYSSQAIKKSSLSCSA